jgi:hypothetical protein
MKRIVAALLLAALLATPGCLMVQVVGLLQDTRRPPKPGAVREDTRGEQLALAFLIPFALLADLVLLPIEVELFLHDSFCGACEERERERQDGEVILSEVSSASR